MVSQWALYTGLGVRAGRHVETALAREARRSHLIDRSYLNSRNVPRPPRNHRGLRVRLRPSKQEPVFTERSTAAIQEFYAVQLACLLLAAGACLAEIAAQNPEQNREKASWRQFNIQDSYKVKKYIATM